jgi:hypothetical protein
MTNSGGTAQISPHLFPIWGQSEAIGRRPAMLYTVEGVSAMLPVVGLGGAILLHGVIALFAGAGARRGE